MINKNSSNIYRIIYYLILLHRCMLHVNATMTNIPCILIFIIIKYKFYICINYQYHQYTYI